MMIIVSVSNSREGPSGKTQRLSQRDTETEGHGDTETQRHTQTERDRERDRERQRDRQRETERETDRQRDIQHMRVRHRNSISSPSKNVFSENTF